MMNVYLIIIFLISCSATLLCSHPVNEQEKVELYLEKFAYLKNPSSNKTEAVLGRDDISASIKDFQRLARLNQTGELDNDTVIMMNASRYGVTDKIGHSRKKRYVLEGSKWSIKHLTYRITRYPTRLKNRIRVDEEIARAFKVWSDVSTLSFEPRKRGRVNIAISFENGYHGDHEDFDGPRNILAHASFPKDGGDIHFDDEEDWTLDERNGTNLFLVAAHEIGHSLGLRHSNITEALMYEYDTLHHPAFKLHSDDILAIQALYGPKIQPTPPKDDEPLGPPSDIRNAPNLCRDPKIDTVTRTQNGNKYVFKGDFYWKINSTGIANGYPRKISHDWDGLEGNLDASLTWSNGKTFFFKGKNYWRFTNKAMDSGYPKSISRGFEDIPNRLDAAFVWSGNGKSYFFKGDQYWRYDSNNDPPVSSTYPKIVSEWNGLPTDGVDAAFQDENRKTYFFKDDKYYRFNDINFEVDSGNPPYPRSTSKWWFGCSS